MSALLPGHNTLTLCGSALMAIVQDHLRGTCYGDPKPRVIDVTYQSDNATFNFTVTTDAPSPDAIAKAQAATGAGA